MGSDTSKGGLVCRCFQEERKRTADLDGMKLREVNYVAVEWNKFISDFEENPETIMKLSPVNYYALKKEYILASCYSSDDLSKNYIRFSFIEDNIKREKVLFKSKTYPIEKSLFIRAMSKFGIILLQKQQAQGINPCACCFLGDTKSI